MTKEALNTITTIPSSSAVKTEDSLASSELPDSLGLYFKEATNHPLLSPEDEERLSLLMSQGKRAQASLLRNQSLSPEEEQSLTESVTQGEQAKNVFIRYNLRLVVSLAKRRVGLGVPFADLIQEGNLGLIRAVEKFDYRRGCRFSTYAHWWIDQAIGRAVSEQGRTIRLPVYIDENLKKIRRRVANFTETNERPPTPEEISKMTGFTVKKIKWLLGSLSTFSQTLLSLDQPAGEGENSYVGEIVTDNTDNEVAEFEDAATRRSLAKKLDELLGDLSPRERKILKLRFGLDGHPSHTLKKIGDKLGLTKEGIRQIERRALQKLRDPNIISQLQDYAES